MAKGLVFPMMLRFNRKDEDKCSIHISIDRITMNLFLSLHIFVCTVFSVQATVVVKLTPL